MAALRAWHFRGSFSRLITVRFSSLWSNVELGPPDPIIGLNEAIQRDTNPNKVNLGVGAYRDNDGKPYVLKCVKMAEESLASKNLYKEYAPIAGLPEFTTASANLAFGPDNTIVGNGLTTTMQGLSGTGSVRVGMAFLEKFYPGPKVVYLPAPSWGNHLAIVKHSHMEAGTYRYFDKNTKGFDAAGCLEDLSNIPERSIILLHACAHNPTGVDPSPEEWQEISHVIKQKNHFPFFDMAYQGFASGDLARDACSLRLFIRDGHQPFLTQSFAKSMGLYGERIGALTAVCNSPEEKKAVESQLKIIIRPMYSSPPIHGARIVAEVLNNEEIYQQWLVDIKEMAGRIISMRSLLTECLAKEGSVHDWSHISKQIGMFCYTGLNPDQVDRLIKDFSIYLTREGRISMAGVSLKNVDYVAKAIHEVTK